MGIGGSEICLRTYYDQDAARRLKPGISAPTEGQKTKCCVRDPQNSVVLAGFCAYLSPSLELVEAAAVGDIIQY